MKRARAIMMGSPRRRSRMTWAWAAVMAAGWNLALFLLMPNLLATRATAPPALTALIPNINVIRMPRPESEVIRKSAEQPAPDKPPPASRPQSALSEMPRPRLSVPFEINPRLPAGPGTLAMPAFDSGLSQPLGTPGLFSVGELDQPLITLVRMPPVYPLAAKRKGTEGWVNVRFVVNEQGKVEKVSIVEAQPPGIFDDSVLRCVNGWRFQPGTMQGRPVRVWAETTVRFELD
ncbi:MAG: TonB family protein [Desulfatitalea sp.]